MEIMINNIKSYRSPESYSVTYDERIQRYELLNGNCIQDAGRFLSGDTLSIEAIFTRTDFNAIVALAESRTLVNFTDESGVVHQNVRIVLRSYRYETRHPNYVRLSFEIWNL